MSRLWQQVEAQLMEMSLRERALILTAALALIFGLWDTLAWGPLQAMRVGDADKRNELQTQLADLNARSSELRTRLSIDIHQDRRKQEEALQREIIRLDEQLEEHTAHMIPPVEMALLLQQLLAQSPVEVVGLEALPAEPLIQKSLSGGELIYRHGMKLEIEGSFSETVEFIEKIEALEWKFFWNALAYEVIEHPTARAVLVLHTLSTEEAWIGA